MHPAYVSDDVRASDFHPEQQLPAKHEDPKSLVSGIRLALGLRTRMWDPHVYVVFGAPTWYIRAVVGQNLLSETTAIKLRGLLLRNLS